MFELYRILRITRPGLLLTGLFLLTAFVPINQMLYAAGVVNLSEEKVIEIPVVLKDIWDPNRYISPDEIKPGMEGYCLTEYGLAGVEKFGLKVVDIIHNFDPGRDAILVEGTDERFIRTGPVAGCSGSPVYIDGRLAGALAFTWPYVKDPLYGVTPIGEMLQVGTGRQAEGPGQSGRATAIEFDFAAPVNFADVDRRFREALINKSRTTGGVKHLPCPLITSGLPEDVSKQLADFVEPFGYVVVSGGGSGNRDQGANDAKLVPGASLAVPLVAGDISLTTVGTVTDVVGDKVYGFGHHLLGYGQIDLPMATGKVHTIVSNIVSSFKLASALETVGSLRIDEAAGVVGYIGEKANTIPVSIRIDRYNDTKERVYECRLAKNQILSPVYLRASVAAAALYMGSLPPDHMIKYKVTIDVKNAGKIAFENISTDIGLNELLIESSGSMALLMNNPYKQADIDSINYDISIFPKSIASQIWSLDLSDTQVKPGETIDIDVVVESVLAGKKRYRSTLEIPEELADGEYEFTICGSREYEQFLVKAAPQKFVALNFPGLINALNNALGVNRDGLYCILALPPSGVTVETAELPDLPATKALILQDAKRAMRIMPYQRWIEKNIKTGTIVVDKKVVKITVKN